MYSYEVFQKLVEERGIRVADVCKATGLRQSMMSDWKRGKYSPKADKMQKIADFFHVPIDTFLAGRQPFVVQIPKMPLGAFVDSEKMAREIANAIEQSVAVQPDGQRAWYFDDETAQIAQWIADNPEMKAVMYALRDMPPDSARALAETIKIIKGTNIDG